MNASLQYPLTEPVTLEAWQAMRNAWQAMRNAWQALQPEIALTDREPKSLSP